MSEIDVRALEANFEGWQKERAPALARDKAFERFCIEQILKDADLSDEEIESGILGGSDDGGVDAFYFFVNRTLIQDETELPDPALTAQLVLIQAKYEKSFTEGAVEKLHSFTRDLLNYARPPEKFTYLNALVREAIARFREKYNAILGSQHTLTVSFHYSTKSDDSPNPKIGKRVENLRAFVVEQISAASVEFDFWGCKRLLAIARTPPKQQLTIDISKCFTTDDGAVVALVKLKSFAVFLADEGGNLRRRLLESNVRDYQGKSNPVNADIRQTLNNGDTEEFWWLNNGITILATAASLAGNKLTVTKPEIVNGLQTSQEIFAFFKEHPDKKDSRNVLIRVIVPPEEQSRNRITKATNFQTVVNPVSLHATDSIHFDIEERFKLYDLFYDRRKGEYRNLRKPISRIISIKDLARSVMAIALQRPDDARARPQTLLNDDATYRQIFENDYNRDLFVACILLMRQIETGLESRGDLTKEEKRDIKYYVAMWLASSLTKSAIPKPPEIAGLAKVCLSPIATGEMESAVKEVVGEFRRLGGDDKVAKGNELRPALQKKLIGLFPNEK
jgi:hypothetical protein